MSFYVETGQNIWEEIRRKTILTIRSQQNPCIWSTTYPINAHSAAGTITATILRSAERDGEPPQSGRQIEEKLSREVNSESRAR